MENTNQSPVQQVSSWIHNSIMLKLVTIGILMLLLLIPSTMVQSIISEREALSEAANEEVSNLWAREQLLIGPILTVPVFYEYYSEIDKKQVRHTYTKDLHVLPRNLQIDGDISPENLKRGIYEVIVYNSSLSISGDFSMENVPEINHADFNRIQWENAVLTLGISDKRGIKSDLKMKVGSKIFQMKSGTRVPDLINSAVMAQIDGNELVEKGALDFSLSMNLQGSQNISFVPVGSNTEVNLKSPWSSPSFAGNFLPVKREVSESGFTAQWQILELNRTFPQNWMESSPRADLMDATFGANLIVPVDDYQKSIRSAKYAAMTIALTFLVFFLVEIINRKKIHPFQYALVGLALCLFYILLVSLSEHMAFNVAYLLSSVVVVGMIGSYSTAVFRQVRFTALLVGVMVAVYGFLFVTLQLVDYALLLGSIGLAIMLALTMYYTRNINWYKLNFSTEG
jgi:inner membrane protein